ncbi:MAG: hypothetical protein P9L93_05805 [Candidatus Gorgyraea atricola]|nr:hypothetical protein [Candidatus Gorgyraea atricola]
MKSLRHKWDKDIWLLHLEADNNNGGTKSIVYSRVIWNGNGGLNGPKTSVPVKSGESYRFILSKNSMDEVGVDIRFEKGLAVKIFRLQDRAYLPGDSDIVFSSEGTLN